MKPKNSVRERIIYISDWMPQTAERLKEIVKQERGIVKVIHLGDVSESPYALELTRKFYGPNFPAEERKKWLHSGHQISNLPEEEKRKIQDEYREELGNFLNVIKPFIASGKLAIVGGNVDQRSRVHYMSKEELRDYSKKTGRKIDVDKEIIVSPKARKYFDVGIEIRRKGIPYSGVNPVVVETQTTFNVLYGFDALRFLNRKKLEGIMKDAARARKQGKEIVLAPHGAIDWKIHHYDPKKHGDKLPVYDQLYSFDARKEKLIKKLEEWKKERKGKKPVLEPPHEQETVQRNLRFVFARIRPDEIIYGHAADPLKTFGMVPARMGEQNYRAQSNYLIRTKSGFYEEPKKFKFKGMNKAQNTLVTYFPDGIIGEKEASLLPSKKNKRWRQVLMQKTRLGFRPR